ncbi:MAG: C4-type zinc ribbon domain-containing protein [Candidatus Nanopelagicales bacterium]
MVELQAADAQLDQLKHKLDTLPETQTVADLQSQYADLELKVGQAQANVADTSRELVKAEEAVNQVRARITKDQQLLDSGSVSSAKQLEDLQHEVASLQRRQSDLEDEQLEAMEVAEKAESEAADFTKQAAEIAASLEAAREAETKAKDDLDSQVKEAKQKRDTINDELGVTDLTKLYHKLRLDHGGVVAAKLKGDRCGACNLQLSPVDIKALKEAPADDVHRCDECRSILVVDGDQ